MKKKNSCTIPYTICTKNIVQPLTNASQYWNCQAEGYILRYLTRNFENPGFDQSNIVLGKYEFAERTRKVAKYDLSISSSFIPKSSKTPCCSSVSFNATAMIPNGSESSFGFYDFFHMVFLEGPLYLHGPDTSISSKQLSLLQIFLQHPIKFCGILRTSSNKCVGYKASPFWSFLLRLSTLGTTFS